MHFLSVFVYFTEKSYFIIAFSALFFSVFSSAVLKSPAWIVMQVAIIRNKVGKQSMAG